MINHWSKLVKVDFDLFLMVRKCHDCPNRDVYVSLDEIPRNTERSDAYENDVMDSRMRTPSCFRNHH